MLPSVVRFSSMSGREDREKNLTCAFEKSVDTSGGECSTREGTSTQYVRVPSTKAGFIGAGPGCA
jgi:hypothetical protein